MRKIAPGFAARRFVWLVLPLLLAARLLAADFQFAWLTDTHVGSATGAEDLRAAVRDINAMTNLSFVVLSGDVTEYGSLEQFQLAKGILDGLKIPIHVIPGNHDAKWSESGATDFARVWGADRFSFEFGGYRFIGIHQGPIMKMGDGHWAPEDVRWLEKLLAGLRPANQPIVFVTHYPVDNSIDNWYAALDLLKKYNLQVILCGHGHNNHQLRFEGAPGVMGRSNLRAREAVGGFNVVEISGNQMTFRVHPHGGETQAPWNQVTLERHDFAADTNRYPRPDFSVNDRYPGVREVWTFNTGWTIAGSPALAGERVLAGDGAGKVYALNLRDGKPAWTFQAGNAVYSTPAVSGKLAVITSADGGIYGLDTGRGKQKWRYATSRPIIASPAIARLPGGGGEIALVGSSEGKMRALDLRAGKLVWEFAGLSGFVETRPLVYEDLVVFGAWDQHLYALDLKTGALRWKWRGDKPGTLLSPAACWPVAADGKVFIVAPDRQMTCLRAATGQQVWRTGEYVVRESIGLDPNHRRFFVRAMNDFFYAFDPAPDAPVRLWATNAGFGYDINSAMLAEKDGTVFYGTKNGLLFALDAATGAVRWQHKQGECIVNTVLPLSADRLVTTDFDGRIKLIANFPQ